MITKIAFVSHPTQDMKASKKFYGEVLGLKAASSYEDKWCEYDTPDGKTIALDTFTPLDKGPYLALETDDIEKEIARLRRKGVPVILDVMDNKVCKMAFIKDPAGHSIMIHQMEPGRLKALTASKAPSAKTSARKTSAVTASAKPAVKPAAKPKARANAATTAAAKPKRAAKRATKAKSKSRRSR